MHSLQLPTVAMLRTGLQAPPQAWRPFATAAPAVGQAEWTVAATASGRSARAQLPNTAFIGAGALVVARYASSKKRRRRHLRALAGIDEFRVFRSEDGEEFEMFTEQILGSGAQGTVYKGLWKSTGMPVAIKAIPTWRLILDERGKEKLDSINEEFLMLHALGSHPNICSMIAKVDAYSKNKPRSASSDEEAHFPQFEFLVMESVEGRELAEHVALGGPMKESVARHLFLQVLSALAHMHRRGIIHRDLKPENVLVTGEEVSLESSVKLIDFGVAKCISSGPLKTVVGTPSIMAPEVAKAKISYNHNPGTQGHAFSWGSPASPQSGGVTVTQAPMFCPKIDVWSAGVVLYTCLTGKLPFKSELEIIESEYHRTPLTHCSEEAQSLLVQMLEKEPEKRYSVEQCLEHPWIACSETDGCTINWNDLPEEDLGLW